MTSISLTNLSLYVGNEAEKYENALMQLEIQANSAGESGSLSITQATQTTTEVQIHQSMTEMVSGIAKNASEHVKGLGRKIGG